MNMYDRKLNMNDGIIWISGVTRLEWMDIYFIFQYHRFVSSLTPHVFCLKFILKAHVQTYLESDIWMSKNEF